MTTFDEKLDRGLYTAADPAMLPPGALVTAKNARYKAGDPAIRQTEGSEAVVGSHLQVESLEGVSWDPGASRTADILYTAGPNLRAIPAKVDPGDGTMSSPVALSVPTGSVPWLSNVVAAGQRFYIQTGQKGMVLSESSGTLSLRQHGFPRQLLKARPTPIWSGVSSIAEGVYRFWWTWYDQTNDVESAASIDSVSGFWVTGTAIDNFTLHVFASTFDTAWYAAGQPSHVRIYRSTVLTVDETPYATSQGEIVNNFPAGFLIDEVAVANIRAQTVNFTTDPYASWQRLWDVFAFGSYYAMSSGYSITPALDVNVSYEAPYPTIEAGGILYSRGGEPPDATTGDIHEDSMLLNDLTNRRIIRYSVPGEYDNFPDPYYIPFDTQERDEVVAIKSLGAVTGIFGYNTIWRLNYLPLEGDLNFRQGKGKDLIATGIGTLGRTGVCRVDIQGRGAVLATCDRTGVYITDLDTVVKLSGHLDWDTVLPDPAKFVRLLNNRNEQRIELWTRDAVWFFHYDPEHIGEDGKLAVTGPIERPGTSAATYITLEDGSARTITSTDNAGKLVYDAMGTTRSDGATPVFEVETREIFPAGPGSEVRVITVHAQAAQAGEGTTALSIHVRGRVGDRETLRESKDAEIGTRQFVDLPLRQMAEALQFRLVGENPLGVKVSFVGATIEPLEEAQHA